MKKIFILVLTVMFPALLAAQTPALSQLGGLAAKAAAAVPDGPPAVPAASPAKGTLLLLDQSTGKTVVVIPVGGGFICASDGRFVPAVFNGSGYILSTGQYMPVVGGERKAAVTPNLTGKWLGWGEWTYQGSGAHCDMSLEFEDGADQLLRKGGYFDCSVAGLAVEPARFVKKGTQLLDQDGKVAGSYEGGVIILNEAYSENVDIKTTIKVDGLHFDYSEVWTGKNGSELYNIQGRLFTGG